MDTSKTSFGLDQLKNPTPEWANWIFRGYFIISKAVVGYLAALSALQQLHLSILVLMVITITINLLLDPVMYGFSKLFGIETVPADPSQPFVAGSQVDDKGNTQAINPVVLPPQQPIAPMPPSADAGSPVVAAAPMSYDQAVENAAQQ